jgi:thioredoxin 1
MPLTLPVSAPIVLDVVCLCAGWCGTCRDYEATFADLQRAAPGHRYRWIDIEDESDLVGDIDVEIFPSILIATQGRVLFAGPVLPRLGDVERLLAFQLERVQTWRDAGQSMPQPGLGLPAAQAQAWVALAAVLAKT